MLRSRSCRLFREAEAAGLQTASDGPIIDPSFSLKDVPVKPDSLIPQHKSDIEAARRAAAAGHPVIEPILGDLLEWMRDMNWPVATEVEAVLRTVGKQLSPHILKVLRGDDNIWKYWVLTRLAVNFDKEARMAIIDECLRIANQPTAGEVAEEVNLAARNILILDAHN